MPIKKRIYRKRKSTTRRRKSRVPRSPGANGLTAMARTNYARCSETRILFDGNTRILNTNTVYSLSSALDDTVCIRAQNIGRYYQEFRITKVVFRFKPLFDTYISANYVSGFGGAPQLYMFVNRDGDVQGDTTSMVRMGVNPRSLAKDGNHTITYVPSVVYTTDTNLPNAIKMRPWLNTNNANTTGAFIPNATRHWGLVFNATYADAAGNAQTIPIGQAEAEVFFEFRRPQYQSGSADESQTIVRL